MPVRKATPGEILGGNSVVMFGSPAFERGFKLLKAREFAVKAHGNQRYGDAPYSMHLAAVVSVLEDFSYSDDYLVAGWLHDVIEDTERTKPDVVTTFGERVAELVWAVTGGGQRTEHVAAIHAKITAYPDAAVVKLADRIANVEASKPGDKHSIRYGQEHPEFAILIAPHVPKEMWQRYLRALEGRRVL